MCLLVVSSILSFCALAVVASRAPLGPELYLLTFAAVGFTPLTVLSWATSGLQVAHACFARGRDWKRSYMDFALLAWACTAAAWLVLQPLPFVHTSTWVLLALVLASTLTVHLAVAAEWLRWWATPHTTIVYNEDNVTSTPVHCARLLAVP